MDTRFRDRREAGRLLADELTHFQGRDDVVVLGLPRGGVPVAYEIADRLGAYLDVFVVRKLGLPGHGELAFGAIASGGVRVLNDDIVRLYRLNEEDIAVVEAEEREELVRRERLYRGTRARIPVANKLVILVDDGLATGATMKAAVKAVWQMKPERVIVAVPVAPRETCDELAQEVDELVCLETPSPFHAVGLWYEEFAQTTDDEVSDLLRAAARGVEGSERTVEGF